MTVLVNGREGAAIDPLDRGLQYGDGLFETLAIVDGRPRFLDRHLERLAEGCRRLGIGLTERGTLRSEITQVATGVSGVVKLVVTRGPGGRGYRPPAATEPTRIVAGFAWPARPPAWWRDGVRVRRCGQRLGRNPALAGLKHLNRLEQVLARREWSEEDVAEGLMLNDRGDVVCGTQSNLFAVIDGELVTPALDECGVAGVMRRALMDWAQRSGRPARERRLGWSELERAGELLLTNSLIGAWPVRELDGRSLAPGPVAAGFNAWLGRV